MAKSIISAGTAGRIVKPFQQDQRLTMVRTVLG